MIPTSLVYASLGNGLGDLLAQGHHPDLGILYRPSILLPIIGLAALVLLPVLYKRWRNGRSKQPALLRQLPELRVYRERRCRLPQDDLAAPALVTSARIARLRASGESRRKLS